MSTNSTHHRTVSQHIAAWLGSGLRRVIPPDTRALSWARRLNSYDEVPARFRPFLDGLPRDQQQPFPYAVLTPTFKGIGRHIENDKLVCLAGDLMHILEQRGNQLSIISLPLRGRCLVERGVLLLYSWITVSPSNAGGAATSATLRFNSVTDHLMAPFVNALRAPPAGNVSLDPESERERFDYLAQTHYKFFSHGRSSVRSGDRVSEVLMQPEIRSGRLNLFGYSVSKRISPAHLAILTDAELILIRDDESQFWVKGPAPGAIWSYIPRGLIRSITAASLNAEMLTLQIDSGAGAPQQSIFERSTESDLQRLVQELQA